MNSRSLLMHKVCLTTAKRISSAIAPPTSANSSTSTATPLASTSSPPGRAPHGPERPSRTREGLSGIIRFVPLCWPSRIHRDPGEGLGAFSGLELFGGTGRLTRCLSKLGLNMLPSVEIHDSVVFDLTRAATQRALLQLLREGWIRYVHCGTPCQVFSRARHNIKNLERRPLQLQGLHVVVAPELVLESRCGSFCPSAPSGGFRE